MDTIHIVYRGLFFKRDRRLFTGKEFITARPSLNIHRQTQAFTIYSSKVHRPDTSVAVIQEEIQAQGGDRSPPIS